jgi:hypothetical protein
MTDNRTYGDLAKEQVLRHGMLWDGDVLEEVKISLVKIPVKARKVFALSCAEVLMKLYEGLPAAGQSEFVLSCRPLLDIMWDGLQGENDSAPGLVEDFLAEFYSSPYNEEDGPDDVDTDAAAASIFAAECFISGDLDSALNAAARVADTACNTAYDELGLNEKESSWTPSDDPCPLAEACMHSLMQDELRRQLNVLHELQISVSPAIISRIRDMS